MTIIFVEEFVGGENDHIFSWGGATPHDWGHLEPVFSSWIKILYTENILYDAPELCEVSSMEVIG